MGKRVDFEENPSQSNDTDGISPWLKFLFVILVLVILVGLRFVLSWLIEHPEHAEAIRDIVIIFVAGQSVIIGLALILLIVQIARLTAIIQNEIRPLIDSGNETVNTLRGTSQFLSDKMVRPVIKINSTLAAIRRAVDLIKPGRSKPR